MFTVGDLLKKNTKLSDSSRKQYTSILKILNGGLELKSVNFLKQIKRIQEFMKDKSDNTKKSYYSAVVSILNPIKDVKGWKSTHKKYEALMVEYKNKVMEVTQSNIATQKQDENWISYESILKTFDDLKKKVAKIKKFDSKDKYKLMLDYMVLALYVLVPPRRNLDYTDMNVITTDKGIKNLPSTKNYFDLNKKQFTFNVFKNVRTYGAQILPVPKKLVSVIKKYLLVHPLVKKMTKAELQNEKSIPLLVMLNGKGISGYYVTKLLNRLFGKKVGCSMLRHIVLSHFLSKDLKLRKELGEQMAHGLNVQQDYVKLDQDDKIIKEEIPVKKDRKSTPRPKSILKVKQIV